MVDMNFDPNRGYTTLELSEKLGINPQKLSRWRISGYRNDGPVFTKLGRSVVYRGQHVIDWLEANTSTTPTPQVVADTKVSAAA